MFMVMYDDDVVAFSNHVNNMKIGLHHFTESEQ